MNLVTELAAKKEGEVLRGISSTSSNYLKGGQYDSSGKGKQTPSGRGRRFFYWQRESVI